MNKETTELLQQLAAKLGTTAEHLWTVMIRQAFISACTDLIFYATTIALVWIFIKKLPRLLGLLEDSEDLPEFLYFLALIALAVITVGFVVVSIAMIPGTIAALANPEYWALKQILEALKTN